MNSGFQKSVLTKDPNGYQLELGPRYEITGVIVAGAARIELEPGIPPPAA